jgi:hypothetical protein
MAGGNQTQKITVEYIATQAQKDAAKFASDEQKRTRETAAAGVKAARELTENEKKEHAARTSLDRQRSNALVKEYRDRIAAQIRETRRLATEEKKAAMEAQVAKEKAAAAATKQWAAQDAAIMGSVKSVGMFAASMLGLSSATSVLSKIVEHFNAVRMASIASGDDLIKYAKELRSLGALEGNLGSPETTLVDQMAFRSKTLQTPEDAAAMTKAALASAQGAMDAKLVKPDVFKDFLTSQGQLQTMLGEDPKAIGNVAGAIPMMIGHKDASLEEMQAMSEKARLLAKGGGFDSYEQAATQLGKVMPWVTSGMMSMPEAMTMLSVEAHGGQGAEAGTRIDEMVRMTSMGRIRAKHMKLDPSVADESQVSSEYMKSIGIEKNTSTYDRIKKISQDLMAQDQAAAAIGERFNPIEYMGEKGQVNMGSNYAAAHMFGQMKLGAFEPLEAEANKVQDPAAQTRAFEAFVAGSPAAQRMRSDMGVEQVERLHGLQVGEPWKKTMMRQAYTSLGPNKMNLPFDRAYDAGIMDPEGIWKRHDLEAEAQRMILGEATKVGVKTPGVNTGGFGGAAVQLPWEQLQAIAQKTAAAGGQMTPAVDPAKTNELLSQIRDLLRAQSPAAGKGAVVKPLIVAPPGPAARP